MRILILSQFYFPEPEIRVRLLAMELAERGHEVTVVTGIPNYPSGQVYPGYRVKWRQWEYPDGVRVLRLPLYPDHSRSRVRRMLNYMSFAVSASVLGPILCGRADVMWVYHPPLSTCIPAWCISRLRGMPFVYEIQDMWPETVAATGMMSSPVVLAGLGRLARWAYRQAAALTVISPGFKANLAAKGVPASKVRVIPNWADESVYRPVPRDRDLAERYGLAGRFNVVYGGNLGAAQAMHNVLSAAVLLRETPDVQFVLIGDGVDEQALRRRATDQNLTNVRFIGRQPAERMPCFFALADAVLVHLKRDPLFEITIPGKLTSYLACGRPIICSVAGDAARIVDECGAGLVCPPEDPDALAEAVRALHDMPYDRREAMGRSGRREFLASYTRSSLVGHYEELFAEVAARSGHPGSARAGENCEPS